ncbi:MAG: protein arginine kinase [Candidatus Omnitrophica bacterium]|nr:protein arginine kinase [Candidatus Omnitrophota bacterium]
MEEAIKVKNIDELLGKFSEWLKGTGPNSDIVISTRIRLARNIDKIPFTHWADKTQRETVLSLIKKAAQDSNLLKGSLYLNMADLSELDRQFLVERHLMSPEHAQDPEFKALVIEPREMISVMINEEDHLRLQVIQSGFNLRDAWILADKLDTELNQLLNYAYSIKWGYLTACPTNTGTGMRASLMLHLPALVMTRQINKALQALTKLGIAVRGLYGEGTEALGNFFQISNQVTLGRPEEDILGNFEKIMNQILTREAQARRFLYMKEKAALTDQISRAFGTLKSTRIITSSETINLMSSIRLGVNLGLLPQVDVKIINELFIMVQPAHLQKMENKILTPSQRDIRRADLIRGKLK